jgi:lysine 2,3-aminomutase
VTGAGHFRTSLGTGMEIMEGLRGHMSGIGIPTYVVDSPQGGGKIPIMPNYIMSMSRDAVVLRNYEGMLVSYQPEDKPTTAAKTATRGVSGLLQGDKPALIPEGNERMARRRKLTLVEDAPTGCGSEAPSCDSDTPSDATGTILHLPVLPSTKSASS